MNKEEIKKIKQQLAQEKGFESWREYVLDCAMSDLTKEHEDDFIDEPYDEVAIRLYRNQPAQLTPTTEVYNGLPKVTIVGSFTHPRPPKEEAERLVENYYLRTLDLRIATKNAIFDQQNTISALKLRGIDTTFEEEVLTILRGM